MRHLRGIPPEDLTKELHQLIANVLEYDVADVPVDVSLVEGLGINSVMLMQILVVLRRTYEVEFEDADLLRMQPATILDVRDLLLQKCASS